MNAHTQTRGLSVFHLKVIGAALLACEPVGAMMLPAGAGRGAIDLASLSMPALTLAVLCEAVSWIAAPIYAWLLTWGYARTRSTWHYALRLLALAAVTEAPYDLSTSGQPVDWHSQNPVFALAITLAALALIDQFRDRPPAVRRLVVAIITAAGVVWMVVGRIGVRQQIMNLGVLILLSAIIFHLGSKRENTMMLGAAAIGALCCITPAFGAAILHYRNGVPGYSRAWARVAFYALYPAMLLIAATLQ